MKEPRKNYKKISDSEAQAVLDKAKKEFLEICQGNLSFFDFLKKEYGFNTDYWIRQARKCEGFEIIKKKNKFYLKIEIENDAKRN